MPRSWYYCLYVHVGWYAMPISTVYLTKENSSNNEKRNLFTDGISCERNARCLWLGWSCATSVDGRAAAQWMEWSYLLLLSCLWYCIEIKSTQMQSRTPTHQINRSINSSWYRCDLINDEWWMNNSESQANRFDWPTSFGQYCSCFLFCGRSSIRFLMFDFSIIFNLLLLNEFRFAVNQNNNKNR